MITVKCYNKELVGVYGLARTGLLAVRALLAGGAEVVAWDDNENIKQDGPPTEEQWSKMKALVISPGIPLRHPVINRYVATAEALEIRLISDIELLQITQNLANYIGVTGTNGKSTTVSLIGHILRTAGFKAEVGGNIGEAALGLLPLKDGEFYVIELSSFQLDLLPKRFYIAVMLSIKHDHIDRHGTFENYVTSKKKIFSNQSEDDYAIISLNNGDAIFRELSNLNKQKQKIIPISSKQILEHGISVINNKIIDKYFTQRKYNLPVIFSLLGEHNAENIAAAFAACIVAGVDPKTFVYAAQDFKALPHRMEVFHSIGNLRFIDDSKATNADSTYFALQTFDEIYWILGGVSKDEGIEQLSQFFPKVKHAFLIGESKEQFEKVLERHNVPHTISNTLESAVLSIQNSDIQTGNVLLSPACASYDQWKNYEERGRRFKELVYSVFALR